MNIQHQFIQVQGIRTHYLQAGQNGPIVLLLHGGGLDTADISWSGLIPHLADSHRVIAPDWPGFGESEMPALKPISMEYYIRFFGAFLDALNIENATLAGISMGGAIALGLTLQQPARVERLILVDSYGLQKQAPFHKLSYLFVNFPGVRALTWQSMRSRWMIRYMLGSILRRPGSITGDLVEEMFTKIRRPGVAQAWNDIQNTEITWQGTRTCFIDRLGEIKAPTLIIHGTADTLVPPALAAEAHRRIPNSRLHLLEGSGHWPQRDDPQGFNRAVLEFLGEPEK